MAPEKPPFDLEQADALLTTTRAVRRRLDLDRPVQRKIIEQCLEIALQAPTGSNRQGWQWIVVTAPETRGELAKLYRRGAGDYLAQAAPRRRRKARHKTNASSARQSIWLRTLSACRYTLFRASTIALARTTTRMPGRDCSVLSIRLSGACS